MTASVFKRQTWLCRAGQGIRHMAADWKRGRGKTVEGSYPQWLTGMLRIL